MKNIPAEETRQRERKKERRKGKRGSLPARFPTAALICEGFIPPHISLLNLVCKGNNLLYGNK
jgi:hypothetical protein